MFHFQAFVKDKIMCICILKRNHCLMFKPLHQSICESSGFRWLSHFLVSLTHYVKINILRWKTWNFHSSLFLCSSRFSCNLIAISKRCYHGTHKNRMCCIFFRNISLLIKISTRWAIMLVEQAAQLTAQQQQRCTIM